MGIFFSFDSLSRILNLHSQHNLGLPETTAKQVFITITVQTVCVRQTFKIINCPKACVNECATLRIHHYVNTNPNLQHNPHKKNEYIKTINRNWLALGRKEEIVICENSKEW